MEKIKLTINQVYDFVSEQEILQQAETASACNQALHDGSRAGNDFLGWVTLPSSVSEELIKDIEDTAAELRSRCDAVVVVGIGGSYLGARAVIDALSSSFDWLQTRRKNPVILYAGNNIGEDYLHELTEYLHDKRFGIINISKSGTTTEPAIAFRILRNLLVEKAGEEESRKRIVAITDASRGALRSLANSEGYKTFVIPDDVGGRYSVLTPVGLLPVAVAGLNIRKLFQGARDMETACGRATPFEVNLPAIYAAIRNRLYLKGKKIEILVNYNPKLHYFAEWWKQLYGESEGKEGKGIFPAAVDFSTDLHSMGQYIQDGGRMLFETVLNIEESPATVRIQKEDVDTDGMNYLAGKDVDFVNKSAMNGTILAHTDGQVPNLIFHIPQQNAHFLGELFYIFEFACGVSGYVLGVNPFDQPGVESYKKNMFALLGKPGFEAEREALLKRLDA